MVTKTMKSIEKYNFKIREECAKLNVTREQIGIVLPDRAQLYFKKNEYNVGLDGTAHTC